MWINTLSHLCFFEPSIVVGSGVCYYHHKDETRSNIDCKGSYKRCRLEFVSDIYFSKGDDSIDSLETRISGALSFKTQFLGMII